jgi:hypothetical protein
MKSLNHNLGCLSVTSFFVFEYTLMLEYGSSYLSGPNLSFLWLFERQACYHLIWQQYTQQCASAYMEMSTAVGQGCSVQTFDQQLYAIAQQVKWSMPEKFESHVLEDRQRQRGLADGLTVFY